MNEKAQDRNKPSSGMTQEQIEDARQLVRQSIRVLKAQGIKFKAPERKEESNERLVDWDRAAFCAQLYFDLQRKRDRAALANAQALACMAAEYGQPPSGNCDSLIQEALNAAEDLLQTLWALFETCPFLKEIPNPFE